VCGTSLARTEGDSRIIGIFALPRALVCYDALMRQPRAFQTQFRDSGGESAYFHVISRVAGREWLFGDEEKEQFRKLLGKQLQFSGLRAMAWCFMGNHFHLLLEVPEKEAELEGWTEQDFLDRLQLLGDETSTKLLLSQVEMFRGNGNQEGIRDIAEGVRRRLYDLSAFMKELKQRFYRRQAALCS